jgi:opacity protein-like surface antigen
VSRLTVAAAVAIFATPALAADDEGAGRASGVYLRGAGGVVFGETLEQDLSWNPAVVFVTPPATAKATDLGDGLAIAAAIGFQYARTRTELEFRRMEASVDAVAYAGGAAPAALPVNDDLVAHALMSNVYFDLVNKTPFTPYIGVGVGGARVENELGERDAVFSYQGRAGLEVAIGERFAIGAEYVYFRTLDVRYGPKEFTAGSPAGPRTDGDAFVSSSVMGTVRVLF